MTTRRSGGQQADRVAEVVRPPLHELGLDLEAVEVTPAGKRRVLRIAVDRDGGITLDDVADATRVVGTALDPTDVMGEQPYVLEVTSRGVDRPLELPRHWRRNTGRLVTVTLADGTSMTGRVTAHDDAEAGGAELDVSGVRRRVPYAEVARALVQVEFNRHAPEEQAGADETGEDDLEIDASAPEEED